LSGNSGASASGNPMGMSRPVAEKSLATGKLINLDLFSYKCKLGRIRNKSEKKKKICKP
jgi:hypothetical protein